jgi:hypothetical protein
MATERQIEANRRNARNSTGPRSGVGKKRASLNAYRHGLTRPIAGPEFARQVEALARQILGDSKDRVKIDLSHDAAQAQLELDRVRVVKVAFIKRLAAFGRFDEPDHFASPQDESASILQHFCGASRCKKPPKLAVDPLPAMPSQEPQRTAEAVRRALPDLIKLDRYEARAITRRDRAIRTIAKGDLYK